MMADTPVAASSPDLGPDLDVDLAAAPSPDTPKEFDSGAGLGDATGGAAPVSGTGDSLNPTRLADAGEPIAPSEAAIPITVD